MMFNSFPKSKLTLVAADGTDRGVVEGIMGENKIVIPDAKTVISAGDELRRKIPNGQEEAYEVVDPVFHDGLHSIPAHFQVKVRKKGTFQPGSGGNYTIHINGPNSRVNVHSQDFSKNSVNDAQLFRDMAEAIRSSVSDTSQQDLLLAKVAAVEAASGDRGKFLTSYQDLLSTAANHVTVLAPFLPALAHMLG